jgi:hypothetical protein
MSSHNKHINHSKKNNDQKNASDINAISDLLNNLNPEDLSTLLSNYNLSTPKTVNKSEVSEPITAPIVKADQIQVENSSSSNKTLELLIAIRPLLNYQSCRTLNKMIQLFAISNILRR